MKKKDNGIYRNEIAGVTHCDTAGVVCLTEGHFWPVRRQVSSTWLADPAVFPFSLTYVGGVTCV